MSTQEQLILISPEILQRIQNDIDKDLEFKKVFFHFPMLLLIGIETAGTSG
jgi:hypothetical protein